MTSVDIYKEIHKNLGNTNTGETGSWCVPFFIDCINITKPKNILEIGFNRGASAIKWLLFSGANLTSIDIVQRDISINFITSRFPNRFNFIKMNSSDIFQKTEWIGKFDLVFIDGDHSYESILRDTRAALFCEGKFIFYDDYGHGAHKGDILKIAGKYKQLEFIKEYPAMSNSVEHNCGQGLYKVNYEK